MTLTYKPCATLLDGCSWVRCAGLLFSFSFSLLLVCRFFFFLSATRTASIDRLIACCMPVRGITAKRTQLDRLYIEVYSACVGCCFAWALRAMRKSQRAVRICWAKSIPTNNSNNQHNTTTTTKATSKQKEENNTNTSTGVFELRHSRSTTTRFSSLLSLPPPPDVGR